MPGSAGRRLDYLCAPRATKSSGSALTRQYLEAGRGMRVRLGRKGPLPCQSLLTAQPCVTRTPCLALSRSTHPVSMGKATLWKTIFGKGQRGGVLLLKNTLWERASVGEYWPNPRCALSVVRNSQKW